MVVISIIILALAMAVPAMSRFTRGRGLENAGRLMQSAISEARRSAITAFKPHYLIMFRTERGPSGRPQFGLRVFRQGRVEGDGYTGPKFLFPASIEIQSTALTGVTGLYGIVQDPPPGQQNPGLDPGNVNSGCRLAIFDDCPYPGGTLLGSIGQTATAGDWLNSPQLFATYFDFPAMRPRTDSKAFGWMLFRQDGTVEMDVGGGRDIPPQFIVDESLYDRNTQFPESKLNSPNILADFTFLQLSENKRRCYVDIDEGTGRARYRVVALNGASGPASTVE